MYCHIYVYKRLPYINMPQKLIYYTNWPAGGAVVKVHFRGTELQQSSNFRVC